MGSGQPWLTPDVTHQYLLSSITSSECNKSFNKEKRTLTFYKYVFSKQGRTVNNYVQHISRSTQVCGPQNNVSEPFSQNKQRSSPLCISLVPLSPTSSLSPLVKSRFVWEISC